MNPEPAALPRSNRTFFLANGVLSAAALAFLAYILMLRGGTEGGPDLRFLPAVNASLNALSATFLVAGFVAIKRRRPDVHRLLMSSAFVSSSLFLVSYLVYHFVHGDTRYPADAPYRGAYLFVLASHVVLSLPLVPLVLTSFYFALTKQIARHRRVVRVTLPIWLYVSVTGVLVFWMLRTATG